LHSNNNSGGHSAPLIGLRSTLRINLPGAHATQKGRDALAAAL